MSGMNRMTEPPSKWAKFWKCGTCLSCGRTFWTYKSLGLGRGKYCSRLCRKKEVKSEIRSVAVPLYLLYEGAGLLDAGSAAYVLPAYMLPSTDGKSRLLCRGGLVSLED